MSNLDVAIRKVRRDLGDFGQPFVDTFVGTGRDNGSFDLSETRVRDYRLLHLSGGETSVLTEGLDYSVDTTDGTLFLSNGGVGGLNPLPVGHTLIFNGVTSGMFTDDEMAEFVNDAFQQHTSGKTVRVRIRDQGGFIRILERREEFDDLNEQEVILVGMLATIECLWSLTTDASTDIDIHTPDGTSVSRSQRYAQMRNQIDVLTDKYHDLCAQLNVGLHRVETLQLRRTSRQTGRLVALFESREYDDNDTPRRILPPVDNRYVDEGDIPSSLNTGYGW